MKLNDFLINVVEIDKTNALTGGDSHDTNHTQDGVDYRDVWEDDNDNCIFDSGDCYTRWVNIT